MFSRSAASRAGQLAGRRPQTCARSQRRAFAAVSGSPAYQSAAIAGVTVVAKDTQGPATKLAVVAKAGTRYEPAAGVTAGLAAFAFKNTLKRSALRITRESELLGGQLTSYHTREAVVLEANFLREHLPYFTELLAEVVSQTKFTEHELAEDIETVLHIQQARYTANALARAVDAVHAAAFHAGLGVAIDTTTASAAHISERSVAAFAGAAYTRPNIAVVADGAAPPALAKWVEPYFKDVAAAGPTALHTAASRYYGGQLRTETGAGNAVAFGFATAGLAAADPAAAVLAALLGGESAIKWTPGFSLFGKASTGGAARIVARNLLYSDAGLFTVQVTGGSAAAVRKATEAATKAIQSVAAGTVSKEDLAKAIARAKFDAITANESGSAALTAAGTAAIHGLKVFSAADTKSYETVTAEKLKTLAKTFLDSKASFAAVGDLHVLPFAEDVGLKA